ncbi:MAG: hypothetical protein JWM34_109 [Ilumatobacteraceae bacterium]|nr:hypothetical protein [Ilumatobacteraceae bacterium]
MRRSSTTLLATLVVTLCIAAGCSSADTASPADSASASSGGASSDTEAPRVTTPDFGTVATVPDTGVSGDTGWDLTTFTGRDIWVDPVHGNDSATGATRDTALKTVGAAWLLIPKGPTLTTGYRIMLGAGTYPTDGSVNYWEDRHGTDAAPIVLMAADGPHTARFDADINMFGVSHFALVGVDIIREGDVFHCEQCDHLLLRNAELSGGNGAHETVKINQSQYVTIEGNDIHGADDNNIDFVAVEHARVVGNKIHDAEDWCEYAKGGSAYIHIEDNEIFDCGTGGFAAGQGTGFQFMTAPWINYEAYGIDVIGNTIHDTDGAGLGVAGGYNIVMAHNTLYDIGHRSHTAEFVLGRRGCDGGTDPKCTANHDAGGWGSTAEEGQFIPNKHVWFVDNLIVNPKDHPSMWQQFQIDGPTTPPASSGVPSPAIADDDLHIAGNVVWNGASDLPSGAGDGCPDSNATCNEAQLRKDNAINTVEPQLVDPAHGDYRLTDASAAALPTGIAVPTLAWPAGDTPVAVPADDSQIPVVAGTPPGATGATP